MTRIDDGLVAQIKEMLPIEEVASRYVKLKRAGRELKGLSPFNAERSPSFCVVPHKGFWHDFSSGKSGSVFDLLMEMHGYSFREALEEAARMVGIDLPEERKRQANPEHAARTAERQREYASRRAERDQQQQTDEERARHAARAIWDASRPIPGTPAQAYLDSRGIGFGAEFKTLRCHSSLKHIDPETGQVTHWPALVAAVQAPSRRFLAVWRIFLASDGTKAPVRPNKQGLGSYTSEGGSVWLGTPGATANVCEGIETGLGITGIINRKEGVQAALSTSGMVNFAPPPPATRTLIWPDGDTDRIRSDKVSGEDRWSESPGMRAAGQLMERLTSEGKDCKIQPIHKTGRDWLDIYNRGKNYDR